MNIENVDFSRKPCNRVVHLARGVESIKRRKGSIVRVERVFEIILVTSVYWVCLETRIISNFDDAAVVARVLIIALDVLYRVKKEAR